MHVAKTPEDHYVYARLRGVLIGNSCTTRREDRGVEESGEEECHQHTIVGSKCSRDLEQDKGGKRKDVNGGAAVA